MEEAVVRGRGSGPLAVACVLSAIAVGMPVGLFLTGTPLGKVCGTLDPGNVARIWGIVLLICAGLAGYAGFLRSRRLELANGRLRYRSWFSDESWPAAAITDVSHELITNPDGADGERLKLWRGSEPVLSLNLFGIPREDLRALLSKLRAKNPALKVAPEARGFFEPA